MTDAADSDIFERWAARGFGTSERSIGTVSYEPQAARACEQCGGLLVGTRTGDIFSIEFSEVDPYARLEQLGQRFDSSVRSIDGCLSCGLGIVVGTGNGGIFLIAPNGERRELCAMSGSVVAVRRFPYSQDHHLLLVADEHRSVRLSTLRAGQEWLLAQERLPWTPRWIDTTVGTSTRSEGLEPHCLIVSADGRVSRVWLLEERIHFQTLQALSSTPRAVTFVQHGSGERAIVFADEGALKLSAIDTSHRWEDLKLLERHGIHFVAVRKIFDTKHLVACAAGGWIGSCEWSGRRISAAPTWEQWPSLGMDGIGLWLAPHQPQDKLTQALALSDTSRLISLPIYNVSAIHASLRLVGASAWTGATDAERFAQLTVAPESLDVGRIVEYARKSGRRTLEGILFWLRRMRAGQVGAESIVRIGAELIMAAGQQGQETAVRFAREVHAHLVSQVRNCLGPEFDLLQAWLDFLGRYFLAGHNAVEQRMRLEHLIEASNDDTPDAFIHAARLRRQGFDLLHELPQFGVWSMSVKANQDGSCWLGVACGDGTISRTRVTPEGDVGEMEVLVRGKEANWSAAYSRVLLLSTDAAGEEVVFAAPRSPGACVVSDRVRMPVWPQQYNLYDQGHHDWTQAYSIHRVENCLLLGTRSVKTPFALWDPWTPDTPVRALKAIFGFRASVRNMPVGGTRRVWAITEVLPGVLAVGAEDGYLRLFPWSSGETIDPNRVRSFFLGSEIRTVVRFLARDRTFLAAGTEGGHIFVFEVREDPELELVIKFREVLRNPVMSLFTDRGERGTASRLFALDRGGRLMSFQVGSSAQVLGKRDRHHNLWHHATTGVWLGRDSMGRDVIAMGAWDRPHRRGVMRIVRIVDYDRTYLGRHKASLLRARQVVERFAPTHPDRLLAAMPVGDASVRSALAADLASAADRAAVEHIPAALTACPDDIDEIKTLLDADRASIDTPPDLDEAANRVRTVIERTIDRTVDAMGKFNAALRMNAQSRGAAIRRLMSVRVFRLWRRAGLDPELLHRWIQVHLQDPEPHVRQEMMRALSEALRELLRVSRVDPSAVDEAFPGQGASKYRCERLVVLIAHYLYTHDAHGVASDCEIDSMGWGATSVLINLLRIFPDSTLAMLSHLSASGVPSSVIHLVRRRLRNRLDKEVVDKMRYYLPWDDNDPSHRQLLGRSSGEARDLLRVEKPSPDYEYLERSHRTHRIFHALLRANSEKDMRGVRWGLRSDLKFKPRASDGETGKWVKLAVEQLLGTSSEPVPTHERDRVVSSLDGELWKMAARLPSPEKELALGVLAHWRRILVPQMPQEGQQIGEYTLGASFQRSPTVFEVKGKPGCLIAVFVHKSRLSAQRIVDAWQRLRQISQDPANRLVRIVDVVDVAPFPALVMDRLDGPNLVRAWNEIVSMPLEARAEIAVDLFADGWAQLDALHKESLYHGDVQRRNIIAVGEGAKRRFSLVDFEEIGSTNFKISPVSEPESGMGADPLRDKVLRAQHQEDESNLLDIAVHLLFAKRELGSVQPHHVPPLEPIASSELAGRVDGLLDQWKRSRGGPLVAFVCSQKDGPHLDRLWAQLEIIAKSRGFILWREADVGPGVDRASEIRRKLGQARVIVLMVSADLFQTASEELSIASELVKKAEAPKVIPVVLRTTRWQESWFGNLQKLPKSRDTVGALDSDETWYEIAMAIGELFESAKPSRARE